ncbi:MAG: hypothetical protein AB1473_09755 [Thermodesulfobacteriota bacterium]
MSMRKVMSILGLSVFLTSICSMQSCYAKGPTPCEAIREYLQRVEHLSIYTFGEDRDKKLVEAEEAFREQLGKLHYSPSTELADHIKRWVGLIRWGHDRLRKGDARMLLWAKEAREKIQELCPQ